MSHLNSISIEFDYLQTTFDNWIYAKQQGRDKDALIWRKMLVDNLDRIKNMVEDE